MKNLKFLFIALISLITYSSGCNKPTSPKPDEIYFQCKIDGRLYIPNSCANCITCTIYKDSIFLLGGNAGFEALAIGIINYPNVVEKSYLLSNKSNGGTYKNSTTYDDKFETDSTHTGFLEIKFIDQTKRIIEGTFYFKAYNSFRNDSVSITEGKFRLKYTID